MSPRDAAALLLVVAGSAGMSAQRAGPTPVDALHLVRQYVLRWQETLTNLVIEEEYLQELRQYGGSLPSSFARAAAPAVQTRRLRSEVLMVRAPAENVWLSFRDVFEVDGRPVSDRQSRLEALFSGPAAMLLSTAERIAEEGARLNLGQRRTVNTPTAALVFLLPRFEASTRWSLDLNERIEGRRVWRLEFDQRTPPFAVNLPSGIVPWSQGSFSIDPRTGEILAWDLKVRAGGSMFRVRAHYGAVPSIREGLVPLRMTEEYEAPPIHRLKGQARYTNHRLFRTAGRIIGS